MARLRVKRRPVMCFNLFKCEKCEFGRRWVPKNCPFLARHIRGKNTNYEKQYEKLDQI
jgi:hypothetical protein